MSAATIIANGVKQVHHSIQQMQNYVDPHLKRTRGFLQNIYSANKVDCATQEKICDRVSVVIIVLSALTGAGIGKLLPYCRILSAIGAGFAGRYAAREIFKPTSTKTPGS